ncbi:prepilin-type N-terminal cleavage/methylation domain-containing protein [Paenibacillus dokdonensis]|uniref:Prepilin-type N-terminal cleavage/methylation domain-containing protein n=1 Tax=Paenibacillus dokdonensis TaxID=2567944 RepID=A0ABU6GPV6_9BACL|nr:prepilin-type N-terminal cleavage/methylation domain-containing protein [Paenibacillus dokdonensis]MEC0241439.1 prepilin-type N-terminal cleavage/methylation domain-containing protein [Paenibacillus dokdonensis]
MSNFVKRLRREEGFTLLEMIATLAVMALVLGLVYSLTIFGMRSYHKISIENSLRDEADLIMSAVITELYTYSPDSIEPKISGSTTSVVLRKSGKQAHVIQFADGKVSIEQYQDQGSNADADPDAIVETIGAEATRNMDSALTDQSSLTVDCSGLSLCQSGTLSISLELEQIYENRPYKLNMQSRFGF